MTLSAHILPHRRRNPLTGEWIICSPQRALRPWNGQREAVAVAKRPAHDPGCHLCPGSARSSGAVNPPYDAPYVFDNDFRALVDNPRPRADAQHPLLAHAEIDGTCRVICFSPRHDLSLAQMSPAQIEQVVATWVSQSAELGARYRWVQVFENKGAAMGCSNPHPHGQIWAMDHVPTLPAQEDAHQRAYFGEHGRPLLADYLAAELAGGDRIVCHNADWVALVPYWAAWPFETLLLPRFPVARLRELPAARRPLLAAILKSLLCRYDNLFTTDFPYSMGWHGAPETPDSAAPWLLHAHFFPPLLRSAIVRKFMVGFEMLAEAQRDLTPETAAARLREVSDIHFSDTTP